MEPNNLIRRRALHASLAAAAALALGVSVSACGGDDSTASGSGGGAASGNVNLVAYSTPQEVYEGVLEPDFQAGEGADVEFSSSFGSSGDQSRAVEAGQPADLVHLPLEPDMTRLVDAGIVAPDYKEQGRYGGSPQTSVVAFTVRGGNPKDIRDWDDLLRDDVSVITPNPFTSGGARWNIMAAYGAQINQGRSEEEALQFVADLLANTAKQDASASDALETFTSGEGDVLISYENEAIRAQEAGEDVDYVIPDDTIKIETLAAVTEEAENPEAAQAFLDYLYTPEAQQLWADNGYRPVDEKVLAENEDKFPVPPGLFDIEELGGWETVSTEFFDPENGSIAEIERDLGVTTG
ncbi:MAG TPA: sulfate ABC transporter substrate-binding protein [Solirubrobacterales bacterium]|nr:sulfate ABC transporter substrate-binding protein [Solirubrobacterales bacterium]